MYFDVLVIEENFMVQLATAVTNGFIANQIKYKEFYFCKHIQIVLGCAQI